MHPFAVFWTGRGVFGKHKKAAFYTKTKRLSLSAKRSLLARGAVFCFTAEHLGQPAVQLLDRLKKIANPFAEFIDARGVNIRGEIMGELKEHLHASGFQLRQDLKRIAAAAVQIDPLLYRPGGLAGV